MPQFHRLLLLGAFYLIFLVIGSAQTTLDSLENRLAGSYGKDKLKVLNELVTFHLSAQDSREALRHAHTAETLAEQVISSDNQLISATDYYLKPLTYLQLGKAYLQGGKYLESKIAFEKVLAHARQSSTLEMAKEAQQKLREIDALVQQDGKKKKGFLGKALRDITTTIEKTTDDFGVMANLKLAQMHESNQNYDKAAKNYQLAINQLRDRGDWKQVEELREHLVTLQEMEGDLTGVVSNLEEIKEEKEKQADDAGAVDVQRKIEIFSKQLEAPRTTLPKIVIPEEPQIAKAVEEIKDIRSYAERAENNQDFKRSLDYYKQYLAMEQTLAEQEKLQELALLEQAHQIEQQEQEITLLKQNEEISRLQLNQNQVELDRQLAFKRNLAGGLLLSALLGASLFLMYHNKRRDHQKLGLAYQSLETTKNQLKSAEQRIKGLLNQQLSGAVANELLAAEGVGQVQRKFVCIMFLDIRDFTPQVEKLSPEEIIEYQNKVLGFMIEVVSKRKGIVNQILGDGFMATFGAPVSAGNDCREAYLAAQEIMQTVKAKSESGEIPSTRIGIGLHAGQVVAGNVGTTNRKQYSITGNPVITAARLEQLNKEFGSTMVMSKEVYDHLPENLQKPMAFKPVRVKGRSKEVEIATME